MPDLGSRGLPARCRRASRGMRYRSRAPVLNPDVRRRDFARPCRRLLGRGHYRRSDADITTQADSSVIRATFMPVIAFPSGQNYKSACRARLALRLTGALAKTAAAAPRLDLLHLVHLRFRQQDLFQLIDQIACAECITAERIPGHRARRSPAVLSITTVLCAYWPSAAPSSQSPCEGDRRGPCSGFDFRRRAAARGLSLSRAFRGSLVPAGHNSRLLAPRRPAWASVPETRRSAAPSSATIAGFRLMFGYFPRPVAVPDSRLLHRHR